MSDTSTIPPTTANADRLNAVVGRLQNTILSLPRFRPADATLAADFDNLSSDLLQTMVECSQAAAVDQASIAVALNVIDKGNKASAESQQLRADTMAKMAERALSFPSSMGGAGHG